MDNLYKLIIKRALDIFVSGVLLVLFFPLLLIVAILLLIANKGNPFFLQSRPGYQGKIFKIVKFKTMSDKQDLDGNPLPDSERLTTIGNIIRKLSIDELPQLINVLLGNMSLIGPRPLLVQYLDLYDEVQSRRHEVRPGITGWAQVNGRNAISWKQKFEFDVWYVDNLSWYLDCKIFLLTIKKVFVREGVSAEGHATMEAFKGNDYD